MSVVVAVNMQTSSSLTVVVLLRQLVLGCLRYNVWCRAAHVPEVENGMADTLSHSQWERFRKLAPEAREVESFSLTYLVDTTGSMTDDLQELKLVNGWVLDQVSMRLPCSVRQFTFVEYNDPRIGPVKITDSKHEFDSYFANVTVRGGGDCPERVIAGLEVALTSSPHNSIILVLTDASAKDYDDRNLTDHVYDLIATTNSKIFFLITGLCWDVEDLKYTIYRDLASKSFGHVFRISLSEMNKVFLYLDFILSRPVNSSVRLFSGDYNHGDNSDSFAVNDNFTELVLTSDGSIHFLQVTNPQGSDSELKSVLFEEWGSMYIVENPGMGTWKINVRGAGSYAIRVEGFKAKNSSFATDCSECHPNGTCEVYFGSKECSCSKGFIGDGFTCFDINECNYAWTHNCSQICVNMAGSYRCECREGYSKNAKGQCVDVDECSNSELNSCHSLAICSNHGGSYTCSCPHGYYGDGFHCELDECKTNVCGYELDCIKLEGSYICVDPCSNHTIHNEPWRSTSASAGDHCDMNTTGWLRFIGSGGVRIPETCVDDQRCSTGAPMWLNGTHPSPENGIVTYTVCAHWSTNCCHWSTTIQVKACQLGYHVYKLHGSPRCPLAYCTDPATVTGECSCAEDEECKTVNGVKGCYCKDGREIQGFEDLDLELKCNSQDMVAFFRTCQLKSLNANGKSVHLSDNQCRGVKDENTSRIYVITPLQEGTCGNQLYDNGTHAIYKNTMHVNIESNNIIVRSYEIQMNFSCSYPLDLTLKTEVSPIISLDSLRAQKHSVRINMEGSGQFKASMFLYKDQHYSSTYDDTEVTLSTTSTLYAGVKLDGANISHYAVVMTNCYATPSGNREDPKKYYIIKERCPNKKDGSIRVIENGVSTQGRFSVQMFKFVGDYNRVYLHCEIKLCDSTRQTCKPVSSVSFTRTAAVG
ncbi:uromodulin-like [Gastrophryne carolinensis]